MSIAVTREERDALYDRIVVRLNGIDSVYRAVDEEDWETAQELGLEFSDLLRLVCEDLGWGEEGEENLSLKTPADVLARAAASLLTLATFDQEYHDAEAKLAEEKAKEAVFLREACERILDELKQGSG